MADLTDLNNQKAELTARAQSQISDYQNALGNLSSAQGGGGTADEIASAQMAVDETKAMLDDTKDSLNQVEQQISAETPEPITNVPQSDIISAAKQAAGTILGDTSQFALSLKSSLGLGLKAAIGFGALPKKPVRATVNTLNSRNEPINDDLRVKIRVPSEYYQSSFTQGLNGELSNLTGIIFPYTPSISYEHKADYNSQSPVHSNFAIYFYKNSSVSPISISGKFTVQNEKDAGVYLATVHMLRSLMKMRSGGTRMDPSSGSPPPVCRLDAYGDFMLSNVPVVISSYRVELPDNVDYYTIGKNGGIGGSTYNKTSVPTLSTIAITCIPIYSRREMQEFSVTDWLGASAARKAGFL
jgi:hypothetical protein